MMAILNIRIGLQGALLIDSIKSGDFRPISPLLLPFRHLVHKTYMRSSYVLQCEVL